MRCSYDFKKETSIYFFKNQCTANIDVSKLFAIDTTGVRFAPIKNAALFPGRLSHCIIETAKCLFGIQSLNSRDLSSFHIQPFYCSGSSRIELVDSAFGIFSGDADIAGLTVTHSVVGIRNK